MVTAAPPSTHAGWSIAQKATLIICVLHLVQATVGFIAEPSFETGPDAPTAQVFWMDYNGWHAVAGFALFLPGLIAATRRSWAVLYLISAGIGGAIPGVWAWFSKQVAVIFTFPNNRVDSVVHLVTGAVMVGVALWQIRHDGGWDNAMRDLRPTAAAS